MKKRTFAFSLVVFLLAGCGLAFGEKKMNIPAKTKTPIQRPKVPTRPLIVDIAIDDIFVDAQCRVWVRWINQGTVRIDKVMRENVFIYGGGQRSELNHVVLEPGAVFAHGVGADPGLTISGAATVTASIDTENALHERNEDNNSMAKTLPCGNPLPDLMPTYVSCSAVQNYVDAQNHACKIFKVSVTIKNFGNKDITTPFQVLVERDSGANLSYVPLGGAYNVPGLAAGTALELEPQYQSDTCFWYLHNPGLSQVSPRIRVTVDSGGAVAESIEDNNQTVHACGGM